MLDRRLIMVSTILKLFIVFRLLQTSLCLNSSDLQETSNGTSDVSYSLSDYPPSDLVLLSGETSPLLEGSAIPIYNGSRVEVLTDSLNSSPPGTTTVDVDVLKSTEVPEYLKGKHPSLLACTLVSFEPGEYEVLPDGRLVVEVYNITYNSSLFFVTNGVAYVCEPEIYETVTLPGFEAANFLVKTGHLTFVGLVVSMVCLFLHLVAFVLVPDLRNLPGWNLAALCLSLFLSYALFLPIDGVQDHPDLCVAVAFLTHFFFLSSILWMSIMSLDVYLSLLHATGMRNLRVNSTQFRLKKFALYGACAFGVALAFSALALVADLVEGAVPDDYRPEFSKNCWFSRKTPLMIFFAAPVLVLTVLNFLFFVLSACAIHQNKMRPEEDDHKSSIRRNYLTYFRLSVIMGVTWVVGIVAAAGHTDWLWVLFVALNVFQGLYIFLAFTCNAKVRKHFRQKLLTGGRRASEQTLSPTFQSYCFYANSIEKDLDKIVDGKSKDNKEVIDTVVIHL